MNFIGSKKSLMDWISACMYDDGILDKWITIYDPMCGMGGFEVGLAEFSEVNKLPPIKFYINDMLTCCNVISESMVNGLPFDKYWSYYYINDCADHESVRKFVDEYAIKRAYFTPENARLIAMERYHAAASAPHIAAIVAAADLVANTAATYAAYLKSYKNSAQKNFNNALHDVIANKFKRHNDCFAIIDSDPVYVDVMYLDPPYNQRQYGANYHLLETIARWDILDFEPVGKTGLRDYPRSMWCYKDTARLELQKMLARFSGEWVVMSYWDKGLMTEQEILEDLTAWCCDQKNIKMHHMIRGNYKADSSRPHKNENITEWLFIARRV